MTVLATTVGRGISTFSTAACLCRPAASARCASTASPRAPSAPSRVASEPKRMSHTTAPVIRLASRHPTNSPGTAAGRKKGRTHSASEIRTWIAMEDSPAMEAIHVNATYSAATMAPCAAKSAARRPLPVFVPACIVCLFIFLSLSFVLGEDGYELTAICRRFPSAVPLLYHSFIGNARLFSRGWEDCLPGKGSARLFSRKRGGSPGGAAAGQAARAKAPGTA